MAGLGGSIHVVPPMEVHTAYVAPQAGTLRGSCRTAGVRRRPDQPAADRRAGAGRRSGRHVRHDAGDDLRSRRWPTRRGPAGSTTSAPASAATRPASATSTMGYPISCIQNPVTGREAKLGAPSPATSPQARPRRRRRPGRHEGGGDGCRARPRGDAVRGRPAARRPGAAGAAAAGARRVRRARHQSRARDCATLGSRCGCSTHGRRGAGGDARRRMRSSSRPAPRPTHRTIEGREDGHVVDAWEVLTAKANPGSRVLVADWRCDWVGMGLAEKLARDGRHVRLAVNGTHAGQNLQSYLRDHWVGQAARSRRRGHSLCAPLRRRWRHRLPDAHRRRASRSSARTSTRW